MKDVKEDLSQGAIKELSIYLSEGFGNSTRIDYGTGRNMIIHYIILYNESNRSFTKKPS